MAHIPAHGLGIVAFNKVGKDWVQIAAVVTIGRLALAASFRWRRQWEWWWRWWRASEDGDSVACWVWPDRLATFCESAPLLAALVGLGWPDGGIHAAWASLAYGLARSCCIVAIFAFDAVGEDGWRVAAVLADINRCAIAAVFDRGVTYS